MSLQNARANRARTVPFMPAAVAEAELDKQQRHLSLLWDELARYKGQSESAVPSHPLQWLFEMQVDAVPLYSAFLLQHHSCGDQRSAPARSREAVLDSRHEAPLPPPAFLLFALNCALFGLSGLRGPVPLSP